MRPIDGDKLMMHLADWWFSSFGQKETEESKAIRTVMDKIEEDLGNFELSALEKQEQDSDKTCETCKYKERSGLEYHCFGCYTGSALEDYYEPYKEKEES